VITASITDMRPPGGSSGVATWRRIDFSLLAVTTILAVFGLAMIYSATRGSGPVHVRTFLDRQMTFAVIGAALLAAGALFDYRRLRGFIVPVYVGTMLALVAVSLFGVKVNGHRAWFRLGPFQLQPSEFGKVVVIVALASFLTIERAAPALRHLFIGLAVVGMPAAIIMLEPDLGTVLVYAALTAAVLVVAGVRPRHLLVLMVVVVLGTVATLRVGVLDGYQVNRLTAFVDDTPSVQNRDVFAQQKNAQTAIGHGGVFGQGVFEGTQKRSHLVAETQTDFIFTVVGEELGFVGTAALLALYGFMIFRIWHIASNARDVFGSLICTGVLAMLMFQIFESVGMTTGIMPIVGIPLPFVSYGGSSVLTSFLGIGLVQSVYIRRATP
jgi:rod shape determining protein RodA